MTQLELCCMTVRQGALPEMIAAAAHEGFDSLTVTPFLIEQSGLEVRALREQCDDAGITIGYIDGLFPLPGSPDGLPRSASSMNFCTSWPASR